MKNIIALLCICLSFNTSFVAQVWDTQSANFPFPLSGLSIVAVDELVAWTTGYEQDSNYYGTDLNYGISKTIDRGESWQAVPTPAWEQGYLSSIYAKNGEEAWLTYVDYTNGNLVYKTIDGGENWEIVFDGVGVFINFIYMWDENEGIILGDPDSLGLEIYTTTDGGNNWTRNQNVPLAPEDEGVYGDNYKVIGNQIWFATSSGRIFHSVDRGNAWEAWDQPVTDFYPWLMDVNDAGDTYLICSEYDSTGFVSAHQLFRTRNNGQSWDDVTMSENNIHLNDIEAIPGSGVLVGAFEKSDNLGVMYTRISNDDGETWIEVDTQSLISYLDFYNTQVGYASERRYSFHSHPSIVNRYIGSPLTGLLRNTPLLDLEVTISPNPTSDIVTITLTSDENENYWILLNSISGNLIEKKTFSNVSAFNHTIDFRELASGVYTVTIANSKGMKTELITKSN